MHKIHSLLVSAYLIVGLTLTATTQWSALQGSILTQNGSTLLEVQETLHGAAEQQIVLAEAATQAAARASASKQLALGMLFIVLGGFVHAYAVTQYERRVPIHVVPKKKPRTLFWIEMRV